MTDSRHTQPRNPFPDRPRPTPVDLARGIGALTALLTALIGLPWLLAALGGPPLPGHLPSVTEVRDTLTGPDDGTLFLDALLLLGWVGWGLFAVCVAVEIPAQLRGRTAPRLPALGASQRLAGALVAAIAVLLVAGPTVPAPTTAGPIRAVATGTHHRPAGPPVAPAENSPPPVTATRDASPAAGPVAPTQHPTYRVRRHDTLWDIAERCLGAGERFSEIAALNYGITQHDGRALTSAHWIYPGWVLRLPTDGHLDRHGDEVHARTGDVEDYTVRPGDTLWDIAAAELGDPTRYSEIATRNTGHPQPDGDTLRDPDHLEPGWQLLLPSARAPQHTVQERTGPATPDAAPNMNTDAPPSGSGNPPTPLTSVTPRSLSTHGTARNHITEDSTRDEQNETDSPIPAKVGLGLAGITVAALLGALARRRALQQRARRPGRRIAMPDAAARAVETRLRASVHGDTLAKLGTALLMLARSCSAAGRVLPALAAIRVGSSQIELLLLENDADPASPFRATADDTWAVDLRDLPAEGADTDPPYDVPFPYPALLTVHTDEDASLLIDLETARALTILGSPADTRSVIDAWAVELAAAPISETVGVTLVGTEWPADAVDAARVRLAESLEQVTPGAIARARDMDTVLADAHVATVREARSTGVASDTWDPEVVLVAPQVTDNVEAGISLLKELSGSGLCVVVGAASEKQAPPGWALSPRHNGHYRLEPLGIPVTPPRLEHPALIAVAALLETSHDHEGVSARTLQPPTDPDDGLDDTNAGPRLDHESLSLPGDGPSLGTPQIIVLGPVAVQFATGERAESDRRRKLTELAAYIALHPGADNHRIDEAIWPARRVSPATRNSATSRLRRWLGTTPDGRPWLPIVPDRGRYRFRPEVRCDWHDFQNLARRGLAAGPDGLHDLAAALDLVRGRPFTGIDPAWYVWAEYDTQEMISAITDVAHALSVAHLAVGDANGAREAAHKGLLVEPASELLTRDAISAATALGDPAEADRLLSQLRRRLSAIDPDADLDPQTAELASSLNNLRNTASSVQ